MAGYRYGVLGAGRQGTAAAYDLVVRGEAVSVVLADADAGAAARAAVRVNELAGVVVASGVALDASDPRALAAFLEPLDAAVSAVPYGLNLGVVTAAVAARTHVCDLGGNTAIVLRELELDEQVRAGGVCLVPDCGEAPGLANNLVAYTLSLLDEPVEAVLYDGGLPAEPRPPWNYALTFHVDGLINEYDGVTTYVRDGELVEVACLDPAEDEVIEFGPPFGRLEAFAANTISTMPWTLGRSLRRLEAKVLRYPGHVERFRAYRDAGLFSQEPVVVAGTEVRPRDLLNAMLDERLRAAPGTRDVVLNRVVARDERGSEAVVDLVVRHDETLGLTAMEQATGWHAAIVCHLMASGAVPPGAAPPEVAVEPARMMREARERGFELSERVGP